MKLWALILLVMTTEALLHYFPWKMLLKGRELPRVMSYTLGVLGLMAPFTAWLWERHQIEIIQTLWTVIASGGLIVFALYGLDHYLDLEMRDVESNEREQVERQRNVTK